MKKISVLIVLGILLIGVTVVWAAEQPSSDAGVIPYFIENTDRDAAHYCVVMMDYDFGKKIEAWGPFPDVDRGPGAYKDHVYLDPAYDNNIEIDANTSRVKFDWVAEDYAIGAVIVQGGPYDNIYDNEYYVGEALWEDGGLIPYDDPDTPKPEKVSHVNFCWNKTGGNGDEECYQEETAWADGPDYIDANQWATYVEYYGDELMVNLFAGQNMLAGTATFSAPVDGWVTITINLIDGWIFYFDLGDDELDDNLKVQDYSEPPSGNPAIGLFDWKESIPVGSTTGDITVPLNNFYGVHLDVAQLIECPAE